MKKYLKMDMELARVYIFPISALKEDDKILKYSYDKIKR